MPRALRRIPAVSAFAIAVSVSGCCSFTDAECSNTDFSTGGFAVRFDPDTIWLVHPGLSAVSTIEITEVIGTSDQYTLNATHQSSTPPGLSWSFTRSTLFSGQSSSIDVVTTSPFPALVVLEVEAISKAGTKGHTGRLHIVGSKPFTLATPSSGISIQAGTSGPVPIIITRASAFHGDVVLSGVASHPGIAASVTANSSNVVPCCAAAVTGSADVAVGGGVTPGRHYIVVRGSHQSFVDSIVVPVQVTAVPPPPDFSLNFVTAKLSIERGDSDKSTLDVTRASPLVGAIQLREQNLPSGVSVRYAANPASGNTTEVIFDVASGAKAGVYTVDFSGTALGITRTASLTLEIRDPDYQLTASPTRQTVVRGTSTTVSIGLSTQSKVIQLAQLSKQPEPQHISMTLPASIASGASLNVPISIGTQASTGLHKLVVLGDALGIKRSVDVLLDIVEPIVATLNPSALTLTIMGQQESTLLSVTQNGRAVPATVSFLNLPVGITPTVTGGGGTYGPTATTLSFVAGPNAPIGTLAVAVLVTVGNVTQTVVLTLTVQPPQVADFMIVAPQGAITVQRGSAPVVQRITIYRNATFAATPINLSAGGLAPPHGLLTISPNAATGGAATLTISTVAGLTPLGVRTLTITGSANGITRTASLQIDVVP